MNRIPSCSQPRTRRRRLPMQNCTETLWFSEDWWRLRNQEYISSSESVDHFKKRSVLQNEDLFFVQWTLILIQFPSIASCCDLFLHPSIVCLPSNPTPRRGRFNPFFPLNSLTRIIKRSAQSTSLQCKQSNIQREYLSIEDLERWKGLMERGMKH